MIRLGLIVEYEGTDFHGSQLQENDRTVQGELERALEQILGGHTRVKMASRTDSGVHALGQVATFDAVTKLVPDTIRKALNYHMAKDVRIRCAQTVPGGPDGFDARRSALWREYAYTVNDAVSQPAITRRTEAHVGTRLDEVAMDRAAARLVGTHDFVSFAGPATPEGASTIRRIDAATAARDGDRVRFTIRGNAFLHQQVRRIVAPLIQVGEGSLSGDQFASLVEHPFGRARTGIAPARGLCLNRIEYKGAGPCGLPPAATAT